MSDRDLTKIKDRIAKLLAKANNNSSEAEAQVAMSRARKLMDKYQLDEMDVSSAADADLFGTEFADEVYAYTPKWREWIATKVADFNDCQCRIINVAPGGYSKIGSSLPNKKVLAWSGFKADVAIAKQMFNYLCAVVDNATSDYMRQQGFTRYNARLGTIFKEAMATRISYRIYLMVNERKTEMEETAARSGDPSSTSLVVVKANLVAEHFGEASYTKAKDKDRELDSEELLARLHGQKAGAEAAITNVLEEDK